MSGTVPGVAGIPAYRHQKLLRWLSLALIAGVLIAAFVLPLININRYHRTISDTLARSIGHPVHLGSVKLQLLPRPGLAITDLIVEDNPEFGAEPLLRSSSVVVSLRLRSLWRGRLEVSRIDLDEASVNLVRNTAGQWNFASLLEQASRTQNAPTAQRRSSGTPRFPYIQFRTARINFKSGNEKKGFAFLNSDLSIWLDNPQQWRLRFEAEPARTDLALELEDTGLLRIEGSLDRAAALDQMPVKLHAEWLRAEVGQASRMLLANDLGWRGDLRAEADLAGTLDHLLISTRVRIAEAHRQEFTPLTPLNIDARCRAEYQHTAQILDNLTCLWPVEGGHLLLTGSVHQFSAPQTRLTLEVNQTPASFAVNVLGLLRASLPASLRADGLINGSFTYSSLAPQTFDGQAAITPLNLAFADGEHALTIPQVHFSTHPPSTQPANQGRNRKVRTPALVPSPSNAIFFDATADLGAPNPLQATGQFTLAGFHARLAGQASVARVKELSSAFSGLRGPTTYLAPRGNSDMDLAFVGSWLAEPPADVDVSSAVSGTAMQGWLRLQNAQAKFDWFPEPIEIASIGAAFGDGRIRWSNANLSVNGITVHGSADAPQHCDPTTSCTAHFNADIPTLDAAALQSALLGGGRHGELLDAILAEVGRKGAPWPEMTGQAHIGSFTLGNLALDNVRSAVVVANHHLEITSLDAAALGGSVHASGTMDAFGSQPQYALQADWSGLDLTKIAGVFQEKWPSTGQMDGGAHITLTGYSASDLAASARGTFHWIWKNGSLLPASTDDDSAGKSATPDHFNSWTASGIIAARALAFNKTGSADAVSGTISFDRKLDLLWPGTEPSTPIHVGGTLMHPTTSGSEDSAEK